MTRPFPPVHGAVRLLALAVALAGCERGCLRDRLAPGADAAATIALTGTDCPDGLARCRGGRIERSRLAVLPASCPACTCPWSPGEACEGGCIAGVDDVILEEESAPQLCAPAPGGHGVLPASGTAPEGCEATYACRGGLVIACDTRALVATCAFGCALDALDAAALDASSAGALLCRRGPTEAGSPR